MQPGDAMRATFCGGVVALALFGAVLRPAVAATPGSPDKAAERPASPIVAASIAADATAIAPGTAFTLAVRLVVPAGWHIYWINPGESGAPTNVDWRLPAGFTTTPLGWPTPHQMVSEGSISYGYEGEVWLTTRITPPNGLATGTRVLVTAAADWVVCARICVPERTTLSLSLPVTTHPRPAPATLAQGFADATARLPQPAPGPLTASLEGEDLVLTFERLAGGGGAVTGASFFPATYGQINEGAVQRFEPTADGVRLTLIRPNTGAPLPAAIDGVLVVERAQGRTGYIVHAPLRGS